MKTDTAVKLDLDTRQAAQLKEYHALRNEYTDLCSKYDTDPLDLDIMTIMKKDFEHPDKVELVRLILRLTRLERELRGQIRYYLFPETVSEIETSGFVIPKRRRRAIK